MLGSDLIKQIVDKGLVDKEIMIIGNTNDTTDIEDEGAQIESIHSLTDQSTGVIVFAGTIEQ